MTAKLKHNKKRNTAFLYETLIRELTKTIVAGDGNKKSSALSLLNKFFKNGNVLQKELSYYKALQETKNIDQYTAEKIIFEAKKAHFLLDKKGVFSSQSALISRMNKTFGKKVFLNFVPSYKSLASIAQIFNNESSIQKRVILERQIIEEMTKAPHEVKKEMVIMDDIVYKTFVNKFNKAYSSELLYEQLILLKKYISSFTDNGLDLKMYLNEEVARLKKRVQESFSTKEIKEDERMLEASKRVITKLEDLKEQKIDKKTIIDILKTQELVRELQADG